MHTFSPSSQENNKMSISDAYKSNAPTLTYLDLCYGDGSAITWLVAWVSYVYGTCGFLNNEVTDNIKIASVNAIMREYHFLNINEMIVFFKMFIAGKFEMFYKKPNPQVITSSLDEFLASRMNAVKAIEANRRKKKDSLEAEEIRQNAISYEEWKAMKESKGEEIHLEQIEDENGHKMFVTKKTKADARLDSAYMIFRNMANMDFDSLCKMREVFIKQHGIDPYELIKKLGNKKIKEYDERRNGKVYH